LDGATSRLRQELRNPTEAEARARRVVEEMALVLQGSLLVRHGDPDVAAAFSASRLGGDWGHAFGTLPPGPQLASIIDRHRPVA
jgi:putative acyl-CoA dehydrogenase